MPRLARIFWIWLSPLAREFLRRSFTRIIQYGPYCMEFLVRNLLVFRDEDIAAKCEGQCELAYLDCTLSCSDTNCIMECGRALTDCTQGQRVDPWNKEKSIPNTFFQDCPCNLNCPNGCVGCPNPICVCGENPSPQNEDNLQKCMKEKSIDLGQCIIDCNSDQSCEQSCVNSFKIQYDQCPCQVKKFFDPSLVGLFDPTLPQF